MNNERFKFELLLSIKELNCMSFLSLNVDSQIPDQNTSISSQGLFHTILYEQYSIVLAFMRDFLIELVSTWSKLHNIIHLSAEKFKSFSTCFE